MSAQVANSKIIDVFNMNNHSGVETLKTGSYKDRKIKNPTSLI